MRFDPLKAFPYPVLRNGSDDYVDGAFQASVHPEIVGTGDGMVLNVRGQFQLSVDALLNLIEKGDAAYVITVDCRDTFTREYHEFHDPTFELKFEPGILEGEFEIWPRIVAIKHISDFICEDIHEDFGKGPFQFSPGNVLAQSEDLIHHISREHFAPVTSILTFNTDESVPQNSFKVELSGDKVVIQLCKSFRDLVKAARSQKKYLPVVLNAIYLPAIVRLVSAFNEEGAFEKYAGKTWFEVVLSQMKRKSIEPPIDDPIFVAQTLLGYPLKHLTEKFSELEGND